MSSKKTAKARKALIMLGSLSLEVYQMPKGDYKLSQIQITACVSKPESSFRQFLRSKASEALPHKGFKAVKFSHDGSGGKINAIPVKIATAYWKYQYRQGNEPANVLIDACLEESIERRADKAFGIQRTEEEYNERFTVRLDLRKQKYKVFVSAVSSWLIRNRIYNEAAQRM